MTTFPVNVRVQENSQKAFGNMNRNVDKTDSRLRGLDKTVGGANARFLETATLMDEVSTRLLGVNLGFQNVKGGVSAAALTLGKFLIAITAAFEVFKSFMRVAARNEQLKETSRVVGATTEQFRGLLDVIVQLILEFPAVRLFFGLLNKTLKGFGALLAGLTAGFKVLFSLFKSTEKFIRGDLDGAIEDFSRDMETISIQLQADLANIEFGFDNIGNAADRNKVKVTGFGKLLGGLDEFRLRRKEEGLFEVLLFGFEEGFTGIQRQISQVKDEFEDPAILEQVQSLQDEFSKLFQITAPRQGGFLAGLEISDEEGKRIQQSFFKVFEEGVFGQEDVVRIQDFFTQLVDEGIVTEPFIDKLNEFKPFFEGLEQFREADKESAQRHAAFVANVDRQRLQSNLGSLESFGQLVGGMIAQREFDIRSLGKWIINQVAAMAKRNAALLAQEAAFQQAQAAAFFAAASVAGPFAPLFATRAAAHQVAATALSAKAAGAAVAGAALSALGSIAGGAIDSSRGGGGSGGGGVGGGGRTVDRSTSPRDLSTPGGGSQINNFQITINSSGGGGGEAQQLEDTIRDMFLRLQDGQTGRVRGSVR